MFNQPKRMRSDSLIALLIVVGGKGYRPLFRQSECWSWVGLGQFFGRQGESERFRCVGITLAQMYENTTTRRNSSAPQCWRRRWPKIFVTFMRNYATLD